MSNAKSRKNNPAPVRLPAKKKRPITKQIAVKIAVVVSTAAIEAKLELLCCNPALLKAVVRDGAGKAMGRTEGGRIAEEPTTGLPMGETRNGLRHSEHGIIVPCTDS